MPASAAFQKLSTQNWAKSNFNQYTDTDAKNASPIQTVNGKTENINIDTGSVPSGTIVMWNGGPSNVPSGWTLCDGSDGAPDLRNRFIVGASDQYNQDNTGGEKQVQLTVDEIPSHSHKYNRVSGGGSSYYHSYESNAISGTVEKTTMETGGDQSHENRPPYYALAYIMKL